MAYLPERRAGLSMLQRYTASTRQCQQGHRQHLPHLHFTAKIKLRYTKGHKDNLSHSLEVYLQSVHDSDIEFRNVNDPLKLLVIQALRTGNIRGARTLKELVKITMAHRDQQIKWKFPHRPVLAAYTGQRVLVPGVAAPAAQIETTLNMAANACGIFVRLRTHDTRHTSRRSCRGVASTPAGQCRECYAAA